MSVTELVEVPHMKRAALTVQPNSRLAVGRLAEQLVGTNGPTLRVGRTDQSLVADGTAMSEAENRLKVARQVKLFGGAAFPLRGVPVKKRLSKIHHVHARPGEPAKSSCE